MITKEVEDAIENIENIMGPKFGDKENPLNICVRSRRKSFNARYDGYVRNLGLNDEVVVGLAEKSGNERFLGILTEDLFKCMAKYQYETRIKRRYDPFEEIMEAKTQTLNVNLIHVQDLKDLCYILKMQ